MTKKVDTCPEESENIKLPEVPFPKPNTSTQEDVFEVFVKHKILILIYASTELDFELFSLF